MNMPIDIASIEAFTGAGLVAGKVKQGLKEANDAKPRDFYTVPYERVRLIQGFNLRNPHSEDRTAHILWLADRMVEDGYDVAEPMKGYVAETEEGFVVYAWDGHCRHAAVALANQRREEPITHVTMIVTKQDHAVDDLTASIFTANGSLPLSDCEKALGIQRLARTFNWPVEKIHAKTGVSKPHIANYLKMMSFHPDIRNLWFTGVASMNVILATYKQHPTKAHEILLDLAAKAAGAPDASLGSSEAGAPGASASDETSPDDSAQSNASADQAAASKPKIRLNQLPGRKLELAVKRAAPRMHTVIERLSSNKSVLSALPEDIRADIQALIEEFQAKADKPDATPPAAEQSAAAPAPSRESRGKVVQLAHAA